VIALGALAAYGGVLADALVRGGSVRPELAGGAGLGALLLVAALVRSGGMLGVALAVAGATYVGAVVAAGRHVDAAAPLVAVLLLLCAELSAWSLDERLPIRSEESLAWRRGAAVGALAVAGLAASALVVVVAVVPAGQGLAWTAAGAIAAVAAAGGGVWLARR
jgi:hypothetical protein